MFDRRQQCCEHFTPELFYLLSYFTLRELNQYDDQAEQVERHLEEGGSIQREVPGRGELQPVQDRSARLAAGLGGSVLQPAPRLGGDVGGRVAAAERADQQTRGETRREHRADDGRHGVDARGGQAERQAVDQRLVEHDDQGEVQQHQRQQDHRREAGAERLRETAADQWTKSAAAAN